MKCKEEILSLGKKDRLITCRRGCGTRRKKRGYTLFKWQTQGSSACRLSSCGRAGAHQSNRMHESTWAGAWEEGGQRGLCAIVVFAIIERQGGPLPLPRHCDLLKARGKKVETSSHLKVRNLGCA